MFLSLQDLPVHRGRFRSVFTKDQQDQLRVDIKEISDRSFGLNTTQCRMLAYDFAEQNNRPHNFNHDTKMAGMDWLRTFKDAHGIALRMPEATSISRTMGFNRVEVGKFFDILRGIREENNFNVQQIFNIDESGLSTVPTKLPKVLSPVGTRRVAKVVSAEKGKNITLVSGHSSSLR